MNYKRIYDRFIADRLTKQPNKPTYYERHHILPKCLGGADEEENMIRLSPEDHFFAHLLLAKIHGGKLWHALVAMTILIDGRKGSNGFLKRSRKVFHKARIEAGKVHSTIMKGRFIGDKHPMYGKPCSELAKQKTRERHAVGNHPMASQEARDKVSKALKGRVYSPETIKRMSDARKLVKISDETRKKMSLAHTGKKLSPESIAKTRAFHLGRKKNPESIEKMRKALTGRKVSEEAKANLRIASSKRTNKTPALGMVHSEATKLRMKQINEAKNLYALNHNCSAKYVTLAMMRSVGMNI
jgi:hypothetical protein